MFETAGEASIGGIEPRKGRDCSHIDVVGSFVVELWLPEVFHLPSIRSGEAWAGWRDFSDISGLNECNLLSFQQIYFYVVLILASTNKHDTLANLGAFF